jgi:adenylate cyclase class IV
LANPQPDLRDREERGGKKSKIYKMEAYKFEINKVGNKEALGEFIENATSSLNNRQTDSSKICMEHKTLGKS